MARNKSKGGAPVTEVPASESPAGEERTDAPLPEGLAEELHGAESETERAVPGTERAQDETPDAPAPAEEVFDDGSPVPSW